MNQTISITLVLSLTIFTTWADSPAEENRTGIPAGQLVRIVELTNRGITFMDQYLPMKGAEAFAEVVRLAPGWSTGHLNLGIAYLNTQVEENYGKAEAEFRKTLETDPGNPYANYCLGVLLGYLARFDEAKPYFETVLKHDPEDVHSYYQLGALYSMKEPEKARAYLEKALELVPNHESACYRLARVYRQLGEKELSQKTLQHFTHLSKTKTGMATRTQYGEMGRYAEVVRVFGQPAERNPQPEFPPEYAEVAAKAGLNLTAEGEPGWPGEMLGETPDSLPALFGPGLGAVDADGDGDLDVYIPGTDGSTGGTLLLWGEDGFETAEDTGIDGKLAVGAFFGDFDKDGDPDLYLTCAGKNRLYRNLGGAKFEDITAESGTGGEAALSLGAAWADADHDGDLDLFVANFARIQEGKTISRGAPNNLYRNNSDGTFTDIAMETGLDGGESPTTGAVFFDADGDRDADIYMVNYRAANRLYLNNRTSQYEENAALHPVLNDDGPGLGCVMGDVNLDGREDLLLLRGPEPPRLFLRTHRNRFEEVEIPGVTVGAIAGCVGASLSDLDLDGDADLVLFGAWLDGKYGNRILMNDGVGRFGKAFPFGEETESQETRGALAADLDGDGAVEMLAARAGAPMRLWRAELPAGSHWLTVLPVTDAREGRPGSDAEGTGLLVEVKTGERLQSVSIHASSGYLSGLPARAHFGLGERGQVDYVRLIWPDAVLQSEMEIPGDRRWQVLKVNRKPSSCPLLFSWDGGRFAFVTDFLGGGGLGFFIQPGLFSPPDPDEDVRIPPEQIAERDGRYLLCVAEPLEEISYIDQLQLWAYDHPEGCEVYPDERFTVSPPGPTGKPLCVSEKIFPVSARDDRGKDVLNRLLKIDRVYVEPPVDLRFMGYAEDHWLELDFGGQLEGWDSGTPLVLYLHGWVEYTYSHVNYAAYQAGIELNSPRIEIPDGNGGWRTAMADMGFPAGLSRMMTVDVSALPLYEDGRIRIRSNMEIFWDQIFVGKNPYGPEIQKHILAPSAANLQYLGYPREYSPDGAPPTLYDYHILDHGVPFKSMTGAFTRYGDVRPLLSAADDRFVIFGKGEEIALEFDASDAPELPAGWTRTFVLHSVGYCKDMDLYTAFPNTVHPLPYRAMENYPPAEPYPDTDVNLTYQSEWNTRKISNQ